MTTGSSGQRDAAGRRGDDEPGQQRAGEHDRSQRDPAEDSAAGLGEQGSAATQSPSLASERRLLIEALSAVFSPSSESPGTPADAEDRRDSGVDVEHGTAPAGGAAGADAPGAAQSPPHGAADGESAAIGCACCGCRSPRLCTVCPMCRGGAALDPYVLDRVADVAALLAEGLRAAARRMAAHTQTVHPQTHEGCQTPQGQDEEREDHEDKASDPADEEGNGR